MTTIGIFAHVDAGKTTLSERLLFETGAIRTIGNVDNGSTVLDTDAIERTRGITVYTGQAWFEHAGRRFTLIDTPGHIDFSAEAERALLALDAVILLIDGTGGMRSHTLTLFRLACKHHLPVLFFVGKSDLPNYDFSRALSQIEEKLTPATMTVSGCGAPDAEQLALLDDTFCVEYLAGRSTPVSAWAAFKHYFMNCKAFPVLAGSGRTGNGISLLLDTLCHLIDTPIPREGPLLAQVYQIRHDKHGSRTTLLKLRRGSLCPRDAFHFDAQVQKITAIRRMRGESYELLDCATAPDVVAVTGLTLAQCGDCLAEVDGKRVIISRASFELNCALSADVVLPRELQADEALGYLRILEAEEPMLALEVQPEIKALRVHVMGKVQLEVLTQTFENRFGKRISFCPPRVLYKETISAPVMGYGHFEPLRHYAEVHLLLTPALRDRGISYESRCHVDDLVLSDQNLIGKHVLDHVHYGILTGSPLTDVQISLTAGRTHLKHTEGGDFLQATHRAIRQGLMRAQSLLLEPYYHFEIDAPCEYLGRILSDVAALCGSYEPPERTATNAHICGRGPVSTLMDYPKELLAFTHGMGGISLQFDGYDACHNAQDVVENISYDPNADTAHPMYSVFCSHGAGYTVAWDKVENFVHCPISS